MKNYAQLAQLHMRHAQRGLTILLFPCSQFGNQEFVNDADIKKFHLSEFGEFELFAKIDVNGAGAHSLFVFLKEAVNGGEVEWNFEKWLVGRDGVPVRWYQSETDPLDIENDIIAELNKEI